MDFQDEESLPYEMACRIAAQLPPRPLLLFASACREYRHFLLSPETWSSRNDALRFSQFAYLYERGALRTRRYLDVRSSYDKAFSLENRDRSLLPVLEVLRVAYHLRRSELASLFHVLPRENLQQLSLRALYTSEFVCGLFNGGAIFTRLTSLHLTVHSFADISYVIALQCPNLRDLSVSEVLCETYEPIRGFKNLVSLYCSNMYNNARSSTARCFRDAVALKSLDLRLYRGGLREWTTIDCRQLEHLYLPKWTKWEDVLEMLTKWRWSLKEVLLPTGFVKIRLDDFLEIYGAELSLKTIYYNYGIVSDMKRKKLFAKCPSLKTIARQ